jgi:predicted CXXCH cytochrome family protein
MKPGRVGAVLVSLVVGAGLVLVTHVGTGERGLAHPEQADCGGCHLAGTAVNKQNAAQLIRSQEELCVGCHESAMRVSHPSGFPVSRQLPAGFPLDWKGDLTCSSCHAVHEKPGKRLRSRETGRDFCLSCHVQAFFDRMKDGAESLLDSGHFAADQPSGVELDAYSLKCMECHAEQASLPGLSVRLTGNVARHLGSSVNHPVGVSYRRAEQFGGYLPATLLPAGLLLPQGNLACVSCHLGYSESHGELIVESGRLCFECHDL